MRTVFHVPAGAGVPPVTITENSAPSRRIRLPQTVNAHDSQQGAALATQEAATRGAIRTHARTCRLRCRAYASTLRCVVRRASAGCGAACQHIGAPRSSYYYVRTTYYVLLLRTYYVYTTY